jgi:hypothetical protein
MKYQILDWAGNVCFDGVLFDSFEDAWGFLFEKYPNGEDDNSSLEDYQVVEVD